MKTYKSKLNIKFSDHMGAIVLWCVAIVCTLGFAAILFQLWLAKLILDNIEVEVHEGNNLDKLPPEGSHGGHY